MNNKKIFVTRRWKIIKMVTFDFSYFFFKQMHIYRMDYLTWSNDSIIFSYTITVY